MRTILFVILLLINFTAFSQTNKIEYPDFSGDTLFEVIQNKDWSIIETAIGFLNSDQIEDIVVILQSGNHRFVSCMESAELLADEERIILVLMSKNGKPKVTIQNNKFIARPYEGGMTCYLKPKISIREQKLKIFYRYTRAHTSYFFSYRNENMILVNAKTFSRHAASGNWTSNTFDFINKKIIVEKGNISSDSTSTKTIPIDYDGFKKLSEFDSIYEWKVAQYKSL